jgi:predicted GIY-YIG superfamily endonuclease
MTVYLLHLDKPLSRGTSKRGTPLTAGHYIGFTDDLVGRILDHLDGRGARFTQVCVLRGVELTLARTWDGAPRAFERRLKNAKYAPKLCPICNPKTALNRMRFQK